MTKKNEKLPLILGFNGSHDGSVALLEGGNILGTISCERITRIKKCSDGNRQEIVETLLSSFSLTMDDIDYVAFCDNYINPSSAYLKCKDRDGLIRARSNIYGELRPECKTISTHELLLLEFNERDIPCFFVNHHLGHVAYSFFTSSFERSICVSLDGSPAEYSSLAFASFNKIVSKSKNDIDISLVYDWYTFYTLGNPLFKSGSMMGLSAYGEPSVAIGLDDLSKYSIDKTWALLTGKQPIKREFNTRDVDDTDILVAATLQSLFEKKIINYLNTIPMKNLIDHEYNLSLSGGSFLNCKLNGILKDNTSFQNIHIPPACGDDGLSVGAALYTAHVILDLPRVKHQQKSLIYSGPSYPQDDTLGIPYDEDVIARLLGNGKVVGFFQGRSEFGPRALGNRSLLADPRDAKMKDYLNLVIKEREWFRPFGASVLKEEASKWFQMDCDESPYMLKAFKVTNPEKIPAVTHVDGTSRIQTVCYDINPSYYSLINKFFQITNVPMLLNTSLNDSKEPMVETPEDAILFFRRSKLDALVVEKRMLLKDHLL
jgi:carbamoyltransferase